MTSATFEDKWDFWRLQRRTTSNITHVAKWGGGPCVWTIFGLFFLKNRFLSDYVGPAWRILSKTPPKSGWKGAFWSFFTLFFAFSCHMCPKTCPNAMKLYPKDNLMFLNTFLIIFRHQNDSFCLSASRNKHCSNKICENNTKKTLNYYIFLSNNIDFFALRDRKYHFDVKKY